MRGATRLANEPVTGRSAVEQAIDEVQNAIGTPHSPTDLNQLKAKIEGLVQDGEPLYQDGEPLYQFD